MRRATSTGRELVRTIVTLLIGCATLTGAATAGDDDEVQTEAKALDVQPFFFAFSVAGKFCFGWLSDRLDKGLTLILSVAVLSAGLVILRFVGGDDYAVIFTYAAVAGIGFSGAFTVIQLWIASFYAGPSYGRILAVMTLFDTLAGALGTRIVGTMRTSFDSYVPAIDMMIMLCIAAMLCVAFIRREAAAPEAAAMEVRE